MMWLEERKAVQLDDSLDSSDSSGEELPVWVRGEQRWVSGIVEDTTCRHVIEVLLQDEKNRGKRVSSCEQYHVTERWRGVEQPLDENANILEIWTAWGPAHSEVKLTLRRVKSDRHHSKGETHGGVGTGGPTTGGSSRRLRNHKADSSSVRSDRSAFRTVHPKRITALQNGKQPSSTEELLKLVLAQGEVIRKQLKKLRHSENQIGFLEEQTHRARVRKHGSNYLLETYLKGLADAVDPVTTDTCIASTDKNSDSGVMTEGDSDQHKQNQSAESSFERFSSSPSPSPSSAQDFAKDLKDDDTSSTVSEATVRAQLDLFEKLAKLNKKLLKQEETLVRLQANLKKHSEEDSRAKAKSNATKKGDKPTTEITKALTTLRTEMAKGSCEVQHNTVVLDETSEAIGSGRSRLDLLYRDLSNEDQEFDMLQALLYSVTTSTPNKPQLKPQLSCNRSAQLQTQQQPPQLQPLYQPTSKLLLHPQQQEQRQQHYPKEMLDTLV